ncbi:MAG: excalibur calcium-binding domain-containing protein [Sphingomonas sp.]|nr:excalibur calcium-binding domain-containing protein [Sphingomonas sp.]
MASWTRVADDPFWNYASARAAGPAPVHAGDPGYGRHLDRDGDGIGCK